MNYFELFDLPFVFLIDQQQLSTQYRKLQKSFHPDQFVTASAQEQRLAVERSALINQAYQTLSDPIHRAEYIVGESLAANGGDATLLQQTTMQDHDFLMQQMILRERLELINAEIPSTKALADLTEEVQQLYNEKMTNLQQFLASQAYSDAIGSINQLKIIKKLQQQIENLEDDIIT